MSERVSVVLPVYGPSPHLPVCLASIGPNADEIVVVDDGGPEPCPWVVDHDPRVIYIRQDNAGVSAARNRGVLAASGDIVFFLDQDDVFEPDKIAIVVSRMQECGAAFAYSAFHIIDEHGERQGEGWGRLVGYEEMLAGNTGIQLSALAVTRATFSRTGLFDPDLRFAGDQQMALQLLRGEVGCFVDADLMGYRLHADNASHKHRKVASEMFAIWSAERVHCSSGAERRARRAGVKVLRQLYGCQAHEAAASALERRDARVLVREVGWLVRHDPVGSARRLARRLARRG